MKNKAQQPRQLRCRSICLIRFTFALPNIRFNSHPPTLPNTTARSTISLFFNILFLWLRVPQGGSLAGRRVSLRSSLGGRSVLRPLCWLPRRPRSASPAAPLFWRFFSANSGRRLALLAFPLRGSLRRPIVAFALCWGRLLPSSDTDPPNVPLRPRNEDFNATFGCQRKWKPGGLRDFEGQALPQRTSVNQRTI